MRSPTGPGQIGELDTSFLHRGPHVRLAQQAGYGGVLALVGGALAVEGFFEVFSTVVIEFLSQECVQ